MKQTVLLFMTAVGMLFAQGPEWKEAIRGDHPRLFFNRDTFGAVKARAMGEEAALFAAMKGRANELAAKALERGDYGTQAAEAAFVFLVTGETKYRDLGKKLLETSVAHYHDCHEQKKSVNWYSFSRINGWAAYDWLFNA